jgi:Cu+-exporting ATPase
MIQKTFRIRGMTCPNCAMNIERLEDDLPGIRTLTASYLKGSMEVEFDEGRISEAEIVVAVARLGYQVEAV